MALASSFPCAVLLLTLLCESRLVRASDLPQRILCVDSKCQEKLGEGTTVQNYLAVENNYVSFKGNDRVTIYGMGENGILDVEVGNQRGYVKKSFVKIERQFKHKTDLVEGKIFPDPSSGAASADAAKAVKATVEPTLADAVPSSPITRSCKIHGTVMYGDFCDDVEATKEVADASGDPTGLRTSIDSPGAMPYSGLPLFRAPNGAKPVDENTKLPLDDLPVVSTTEMPDMNTAAAGEDPGVKVTVTDEGRPESLSSEAAEVDSETLADEGAVGEEGSEEAEDKPKPIPGEGDEEEDDDGHVEVEKPDQSDRVEHASATSKEVHASSETSLDASPVDETVAYTVATPPLEQPKAVDSTEGTSPTISLQESSTSTSEASLAKEMSYGYSQTDESPAVFSMSAELPEQHLDASSPLPSEQFSSMAGPDASLSASPVDESAATPNTATPSLEQQQSVPAASTEDISSAATEGLAASVETGPGASSVDEPAPSIFATPLVEPQLSEQTSSAQDVTLPASSSTAHLESAPASLAASTPAQAEPGDSFASQPAELSSNVPQAGSQLPEETSAVQDLSSPSLSSKAHQESAPSFLATSEPSQAVLGESSASQSTASLSAPQGEPQKQSDWASLVDDLSGAVSHSVPQDSSSTATTLLPLDAWNVSTAVDEPLASATTVPSVEQPVAASTVEDSLPTSSSVPLNQFRQELVGSDNVGGSIPSSMVTQSLDSQQIHSTFSEQAPSTSESSLAASLASSTVTSSESSAGGIGATEALDAHTTPVVPVGESLEPPPSLLPADELAKPPGVPLPEKQTQPTEDEPSGFVMDWKVFEEYLWQVLALVPEPLRAALEWPLVPSLPVLMACCALLLFSLGASLHTAWLQRSKVSSLTGILSEREQELFTLKTERQVLSEQLAQAKKESVGNDRALGEQKRELEALRDDTKERTKQVDKLTGQLSEKTQQLESAQAALQQAQKLLKERSTEAKERGDAAAFLEEQLREVREERDRWQEQAQESEAQEQMLRQSLNDATETSDRLWAELEALKRRQEELCEEVAASNRQADSVADKLRQKEDRILVLESSLEQMELLQKRWRSRKSENESENGAENDEEEREREEAENDERRHSELKELLDATQARRERDQAEEQCRQLQAQLDELREKLHSQEAQVESLRKELELSVAIKVESERKCAEAQTKLEVLTEYFKDREVQLQKEVGLQEVQRRQREADASTTAQHVAVLEQQCQSLQSQLDSLGKEMQLTERNYKNQVTDQEKRAHDNWLAARAAERKLEDANRELSALRQRLTLAERELQQRPPLLPPPELFPPPPLPPRPRSKDGSLEASSLDGSVPPPPPLDMLVPPPPPLFGPFGMFGPFPPPPPPPEMRKMMRSERRGSPGYFEDDDELGSPMPPPPPHHHHHHHHYMTSPPREGGRSNRTSRSSSASESKGRPLKSSPQSPLSDDRRNGTSGRSTPL